MRPQASHVITMRLGSTNVTLTFLSSVAVQLRGCWRLGLVISAFGMINPFGMRLRANATYDFSSAGQHYTVPKPNLTSAHETLLHNAQVLHETLRMQFSKRLCGQAPFGCPVTTTV